jgi:hypothetical protein
MITTSPESDNISVFTYDGVEGDKINLYQLHVVVDRYFGKPCALVKIGEGGYHKVFNLLGLFVMGSLNKYSRCTKSLDAKTPKVSMLSSV